MKLTLSEEQEMLKTSARDFLTAKLPKKTVEEIEQSEKGYSPELWQEISGLRWMGLTLPEKYGGAEMSFLDLAVLFEEIGRGCLPGPFFSTVILGAYPLMEFGTDVQKDTYLPKIATGEYIFTAAIAEEAGTYNAASVNMQAVASGSDFVLSGTKYFVPDANVASYIMAVARTSGTDGFGVFIVDAKNPGIKTTVFKGIAGDNLCEVVFDKVKVGKDAALKVSKWADVQKIIERAAVAKCCEMVGCVQKALEMTVDYSKQRKQYGKPIGSFQVLQHYCADMAIDVEGTRLSTYQAAWRLSEGLPASEEIAIAKAWAGDASVKIMASAHQIHGAIGCTLDHDLQYYTRRAKAAEVSFGDSGFYRGIVAAQTGL